MQLVDQSPQPARAGLAAERVGEPGHRQGLDRAVLLAQPQDTAVEGEVEPHGLHRDLRPV
ncbi:hypothetical protein OG196_43485 (plasmid) [Kitasatospora purpeofusca]|uniref:hypothetical protein n=1 Tax=Kitasatospora purpeofusca TaxID=67352 RepID=UPI002E0D8A84|nr:hypothetical protein OG196_43485 [Kitasatospora purpeofusca]